MAFIMNEFDIDMAVERYLDDPSVPNLSIAVDILDQLRGWTNLNSDGWPYWGKPSNAATKLQEAIEAGAAWREGTRPDLPARVVKEAVRPVLSFLTKQSRTEVRNERDRVMATTAAMLRNDFKALTNDLQEAA